MYEPTKWKDEVVEHPYRYKETTNSDGSIEHTPDPGEVLQQGTPQSATNFNKLEYGLFEGHEIALEAVRIARQLKDKVDSLDGEKIQVELTNTQDYPFNNSKKAVQISQKNTKNYTVTAEVFSVEKGSVGDIVYSDKLLNGFKVAYTGSAKKVVLNLYVQGGI